MEADSTNGLVKKLKNIQLYRVLAYVALHIMMFGHQILYKLGVIDYGNVSAIDYVETLENGTIRFGTLFILGWFIIIPIFGRMLCGWACHMGALQDFGAWIVGKLPYLKNQLRKIHLLDSSRLRFLLPIIVFITLTAPPIITGVTNYLSSTGFEVNVNMKKEMTPFDVSEAEVLLSWFLVGFVFVGMFGKRPVCRYVCPFATVFLRPLQKKAMFKFRKVDHCTGCNSCSESCVMGIDVAKEINTFGYVNSAECVNCFRCIDDCGHGTIAFTTKTGNEVAANAVKPVDPYKQVKMVLTAEVAIIILSAVGGYMTYEDTGTIAVLVPAVMCSVFLFFTLGSWFIKRKNMLLKN